MKKSELINQIYNKSNLPKGEVKLVIDTLEDSLVEHLPTEDKIKLGIGYFYKTISGHARFSPSPRFSKRVKETAISNTTASETKPTAPEPKNQQGSVKQSKGIKKNALRNNK